MSYSPRTHRRTQAAVDIREIITKGVFELESRDPERERYIPEKDLSRWVTRDAILEWIEESGIEYIEKAKFADDIVHYALKTFCILMEIEREDCIKWFVESHRSFRGPDAKLPWKDSAGLASFFKREDGSPEWSRSKVKDFCERQWRYVVPKFYEGRNTRIPDNSKFPFFSNRSRETQHSGLFEVDFDARYLLSHEGQQLESTDRVRVGTRLYLLTNGDHRSR